MKLEGTYTFDAPRDVVWEALLDPEKVGDNEYQGMLRIRVGPVQGKFQGKVTLLDISAPTRYRLVVDGKGTPGFMKGEGQVELEAENGSTVMIYSGEAQVGGRIASVGQRLLDSSAKALTKQSLDGLNRQIQTRLQAQAAAANGTSAVPLPELKAPSEMKFAMGMAKDMVADLIPPERRIPLLAAGLGAIAFFLFLTWWTNVVARKVAHEIWERR